MKNNYWKVDEQLIFKPEFNKKLTKYYNMINIIYLKTIILILPLK